MPARELFLITITNRHKLHKKGSYLESSVPDFQQSDYFVNSVLAVSFCSKSFEVSSVVLKMTFFLFLFSVNRVSGYIYT